MRADLLCLEQVNILGLLMDLEIPNSKKRLPQAMHWLIGFDLNEGI